MLASNRANHGTAAKLRATVCLLTATAIFGAGNVSTKAILGELDVWMLLAVRSTIAMACLAPWAIAELRESWPQRQALVLPMLYTSMIFSGAITLQSLGAAMTSATNLGFIINLSVVFTPVLCFVLGKAGINIRLVLACIVSIAGAATLSCSSITALSMGDVLCLGAALLYSAWIISVQETASRFRCSALLPCLQWVLPAGIGYVMSGQALPHVMNSSVAILLQIAFLGAGASALGYLLAARAQRLLSPVSASLIYAAEAVFGMLAAMAWLGESLTRSGLLGAALIMLGIGLASLLPAGQPLAKTDAIVPMVAARAKYPGLG